MGLFEKIKKRKTNVSDREKSITNDIVLVDKITNTQINEANLIEITDKNILAKIDSLIPSVATSITSARNVAQGIAANSEPLYRVVLKRGGQLVESRTMDGAKRAMTMGENGIRENANLVRVDAFKKSDAVATVGTNALNVASMIVGQYYMQQIDDNIKSLQVGIETILNFLDVQYKSQVIALLEAVYSITKFQTSSLEREELRNRELDALQPLKIKCLELLNQAEIHLQNLISVDSNDYSEYAKTTNDIKKWLEFQHILFQLLNQISMLDFTLHLGVKPQEQCFDNYITHSNKEKKRFKDLAAWHKKQCDALQIDLDNKRRKNAGLLALLEKPISMINDEWNYHSIDDETIALIQDQSQEKEKIPMPENNAFEKDVQIVVIGDKKYFSPCNND